MTIPLRSVLVCGGRDRHQDPEDALWLRAWLRHMRADLVIHGDGPHCCERLGCRRLSVDRWAAKVARRLELGARSFPAQWREGPGAGPRRNIAMLDQGPMAVLALPGQRGYQHVRGCGTGHVVHHARARGIFTLIRGIDGLPEGARP